MVKSDRWNLIKLLGKTGSLEILEELNQPKRYSQIKHLVSSDKTLSERLKELEENKLITTVIIKIANRPFIHYQLTSKGNDVLKKIKEIK